MMEKLGLTIIQKLIQKLTCKHTTVVKNTPQLKPFKV